MISFNIIYNFEAVEARLKIFMGLALVHFQKYWLLSKQNLAFYESPLSSKSADVIYGLYLKVITLLGGGLLTMFCKLLAMSGTSSSVISPEKKRYVQINKYFWLIVIDKLNFHPIFIKEKKMHEIAVCQIFNLLKQVHAQ